MAAAEGHLAITLGPTKAGPGTGSVIDGLKAAQSSDGLINADSVGCYQEQEEGTRSARRVGVGSTGDALLVTSKCTTLCL